MNGGYSLKLERDPRGRITGKIEDVRNYPVRWTYSYDEAGRLVGASRDGTGVERYLYDERGRRAEDYVPLRRQADRSFRYGRDDRLLQAGDALYEHDAAGFRSLRVTPQGETRYHYASDYRLLAVELPDGRTVEYAHDDQGLRHAKLVDGALVEQYRWGDRFRLSAWFRDGRWWEVAYGRDGRPEGLIDQTDGHNRIILHTDQIGTVRMVELQPEDMVKEILYDSFGNVIRDGNPYLPTPFGFAGGLHDRDTGLVRFGWRDYDPDTGRFTALDPIGAAGGDSDWYGYCLDDPVNGMDPTGLQSLEFDGRQLKWYDVNGEQTDAWNATSGPFGKGALPDGGYTASNLRSRSMKGMVCPDGTGWSVDIDPDKPNGRDLLRIHPDQAPQGTYGCIGVDCRDANGTRSKLEEYFETHKKIPLNVKTRH